MSWESENLHRYLDDAGDLAPSWAEFPTCQWGSIGWRMGAGESWRYLLHEFLKTLSDYESRLAYLRRHPVAPMTWADDVQYILYPDSDGDETPPYTVLLELGLIGSDVAYHTWLAKQDGVRWPWEDAKTPETAARYHTRNLWFWSRQIETLRQASILEVPEVPKAWAAVAPALFSGVVNPDLSKGLLTLAQMLAAGALKTPWQMGLAFSTFEDSFEKDMGYADAFRLWTMAAFDDRPHAERFFAAASVPAEWQQWLNDEVLAGLKGCYFFLGS